MNRQTVVRMFMEDVMPAVRAQYEQDGRPDYPARCEAWGAFTDSLCKGGEITPEQYDRWAAPKCCG